MHAGVERSQRERLTVYMSHYTSFNSSHHFATSPYQNQSNPPRTSQSFQASTPAIQPKHATRPELRPPLPSPSSLLTTSHIANTQQTDFATSHGTTFSADLASTTTIFCEYLAFEPERGQSDCVTSISFTEYAGDGDTAGGQYGSRDGTGAVETSETVDRGGFAFAA